MSTEFRVEVKVGDRWMPAYRTNFKDLSSEIVKRGVFSASEATGRPIDQVRIKVVPSGR